MHTIATSPYHSGMISPRDARPGKGLAGIGPANA